MSGSNIPARSIGEPTFGVPVGSMFADSLPGIETQAKLPALTEDTTAGIDQPSSEALVQIRHQRIRTLANYWHGRWDNAIPETLIRAGVSQRLYAVAEALPARWGLAVFDAWRPLALQSELYDAAYADPTTEADFMAPASTDPATAPPHLTGGAVDLTLTFDGTPLAPGCDFDDTTKMAYADSIEHQDGPDREVRRYLHWSMRAQGFVVFKFEWWHFEFGTRRWAAITDRTPIYGGTAPALR
ncbi:MAG: M15 family metallopeptidase [Actinobacteria bacterium]|nr:M15 family metallopeptidase [Actinomycetota bacterium]